MADNQLIYKERGITYEIWYDGGETAGHGIYIGFVFRDGQKMKRIPRDLKQRLLRAAAIDDLREFRRMWAVSDRKAQLRRLSPKVVEFSRART